MAGDERTPPNVPESTQLHRTDSQMSAPMVRRPLARSLAIAVVGFLTLGLAMQAAGYIAQTAFLMGHRQIPTYAGEILRWSPDRYEKWRDTVLPGTTLTAMFFVCLVGVLLTLLVARAPGVLWAAFEQRAARLEYRKGAIYYSAAGIASAFACILSIDASSTSIVGWVVQNSMPYVILCTARVAFRRGPLAPIVSTVLLCICVFVMNSMSPIAMRNTSEGVVATYPGVLPETQAALQSLMSRVGYPMDKVYVHESFTGAYSGTLFGEALVLGKSLVQDSCVECVLGVAAHELGHRKGGHMHALIADSVVSTGVVALLPWILASEHASWLLQIVGATEVAHPFGLGVVLTPLVAAALHFIFLPATLALSRQYETDADQYAFDMGYAAGIARTFRESDYNSAGNIMTPLFEGLVATHPETTKRVKRADSYIAAHA